MKKIFTLMAATALGVSGLMAASFNPAQLQGLKAEFTPEGLQQARASLADMKVNGVDGEYAYTRSYVDAQGGTWNATLVTRGTKLADVLSFKDQAGNTVQYSFYEFPFYEADLSFSYTPKNQSSSTRYVDLILAWPSYYMYSQIFEVGTMDIPEDEIDGRIVPPSELMNDANFCRLFEQTGYTMNWNQDTGNWDSWTILPGDVLNVQCEWDGLTMFTQDGSTIDMKMYDPADGSMSVQTKITLKENVETSPRAASMRITYAGTGRVEGFEHVEETLPEFGDFYLFNTGSFNFKEDGPDSGFTEEFPDLSKMFFFCGDSKLMITVEESGPFSESKVGHNGLDVTQEEVDEHAQIFYGYLFTDPKYAQNQDETPTDLTINIRAPWSAYDESTDVWYSAEAPEVNTFVPMGYTSTWSRELGALLLCHNEYEIAGEYSTFGWGTTTGFHMEYATIYNKLLKANAPNAKVYYYYDPSDLSKKREFSAVGTREWSGVENVVAEGVQAQVVARDGMISVNAGEKAPIAIFTLDGKLVKATEAENVAVEAAKGVYVVRVGEKATKVVL